MAGHRFTRRQALAALGGLIAAGTAGAAHTPQARATALAPKRFPQGIASADPQPDAVLLWTRAEPAEPGNTVALTGQVSESADFARVVLEQRLTAEPASDHTVRLLARGLRPDTEYFYRFVTDDGAASRTGRTRTAPAPDALRSLRLAFVSCQNFEQGFYGSWARMIADDEAAPPDARIDLVLHLGDFIYEVLGESSFFDPVNPRWLRDAQGRERFVPPMPDGSAPWEKSPYGLAPGAIHAVSLADYRHLYKVYLSDPHLQAARGRWPFVCTWDDHEFTNDSWREHQTYFGPSVPEPARKRVANQAWFEFIPALLSDAEDFHGLTQPARDFDAAAAPLEDADWPYAPDAAEAIATLSIERALRWGRVADVLVTDLRSHRSPPAVTGELRRALGWPLTPVELMREADLGREARGGHPPATFAGPDGTAANPRAEAPPGSMLGRAQRDWFEAALGTSKAIWKIWANSMPAMALRLDLGSVPGSGMPDMAAGTDGWNGYPGELRRLLGGIAARGITNVVSLAGDHHMHGAALLPDDPDADDPRFVAVELATAGISSTPMYEIVQGSAAANPAFAPLIVYEADGRMVENWNLTLLRGANAAFVQALTGSALVSAVAADPKANPGVSYIDSNAVGYGLVTFEADRMTGELVTCAPAVTDFGAAGAPVMRRARFSAAAWAPGERPWLAGPMFSGSPPHPFA